MSTVDTRLSNLNIWEGTTSQLDGVEVGVNDMVFVTDVEFEEKFRYTSMPEASDHIGEIVQYIGLTNDTYTQGAFYKCVKTNTIDQHAVINVSTTSVSISNIVITDPEKCLDDFASHYVECEIGEDYTMGYRSDWALWCYPVGSGNSYHYYRWMTYDGDASNGDEITLTYVSPTTYVCQWVLIEPANTVGFSDISGEPRDNTALDEELTDIENRAIIQVTTLPEITDDTKDKIYQYVGENDYDNGLYQGSFYKAFGSTYELDTENSQLIDDMSFIVNDEAKFLQTIEDTYQYNTGLPDQSYFNIVFYGNESPTDGYATAWWIDKSVRPTICNSWNERYSDIYGGIKFGGQPTITDINDSDPDTTPNTYFHILISKPNTDYQYWKWYPISIYPYQNINNEQVLVNKSRYSTSISEKKSGVTLSTDGPRDTILGVGAGINWDKRGDTTAIGYNAVGGYLGTTLGSNANGANCSVTIGFNASTTSEYGVTIGASASSTERTVAIGERASASAYYGVALGPQSSSSHDEGIAIGRRSMASGQHSIAIGAWTEASGAKSVTLGWSSYATGTGSVQLGEGRNDNANTLQFKTYTLVLSDGTVPYQRLASNTPQDGYALVYNSSVGKQVWQNVIADIPVIQVTEMPEPDEGMVIQYIGENDGELIKGYWYEAVYNETGDYWYWRQIDVQPEVSNVSYDDLSDKPSINGVTIEGDLDLVDDFNLARVAQTGSYADLTTKPGINGHPLLANTQAVDLQISYNDLIDKPAGPSTVLPDLPQDKDDYDYMLKWDHVEGKLIWIRAIDEQEDLGTLPAVN